MVVKVRSFGLYSYPMIYGQSGATDTCRVIQGVEALTNRRVKSRLHFFYMSNQSQITNRVD